MLSNTLCVSSGVGFSKSTQRKRLVSASNVGIKNKSMSLVCKRPWVVNASDRIIPANIGIPSSSRESIFLFEAPEERSAFSRYNRGVLHKGYDAPETPALSLQHDTAHDDQRDGEVNN